jgi:thioredoxin-related protein
MKYFVSIVLIVLTFGSPALAQGMEFFNGTFEEALEQAKKEDKAIFVDAYTTWCGPCKRMSKYVFTEKSVGDYYNANFINLKLDMEKEPGMKFRTKYPVSAFPTFYYLDPEGEVLYTTKGGRKPDQFIDLGKQAMARYDRTSEFRKKYVDGDRSYETVHNYIKGLNKTGESSLKIANDYLNSQENLSTEENLKIIYESMTEVDSRIFDLFTEYKSDIARVVGAEEMNDRVRMAADATVEKAIEYKEESLLEEAQEKRAKHLPDEEKEFNLASSMKFGAATENSKIYLKNAKKYERKYAKDARSKNELVESAIEKFKNDKDVMKWAADVADDAREIGGLSNYHLNYAYTQYHLGNEKEALAAAEKALELAGEEKVNPTPARSLIAKLSR